ncbi:unnamed protein product, partial [Pylaiella littoralis]
MGATWLCNVHRGRARKQLCCRWRVRGKSHRWSRLDFPFTVFWRILRLRKQVLCKRGAAVERGGLMAATVRASSAATAATAVTSMVPVISAATAAGTETRVIGPTTAATTGAPTGAGLLTAASDSPFDGGKLPRETEFGGAGRKNHVAEEGLRRILRVQQLQQPAGTATAAEAERLLLGSYTRPRPLFSAGHPVDGHRQREVVADIINRSSSCSSSSRNGAGGSGGYGGHASSRDGAGGSGGNSGHT